MLAYEDSELVHRSDLTPMLTAPATPSQPDPPRLIEATDEGARIGWLPPADNGTPTIAPTATRHPTPTPTLILTPKHGRCSTAPRSS